MVCLKQCGQLSEECVYDPLLPLSCTFNEFPLEHAVLGLGVTPEYTLTLNQQENLWGFAKEKPQLWSICVDHKWTALMAIHDKLNLSVWLWPVLQWTMYQLLEKEKTSARYKYFPCHVLWMAMKNYVVQSQMFVTAGCKISGVFKRSYLQTLL